MVSRFEPVPGWSPGASPSPGDRATPSAAWCARHRGASILGVLALLVAPMGVALLVRLVSGRDGVDGVAVAHSASVAVDEDVEEVVVWDSSDLLGEAGYGWDDGEYAPEATGWDAGGSALGRGASGDPEDSGEDPDDVAPVRDGVFDFVISGAQRATVVGQEPMTLRARGRFLLLHITVTNVGTVPRVFDYSAQRLIDDRGRVFSPDLTAGAYLGSANGLIQPIEAGRTAHGPLVFDVPKGTDPDQVELHDSAYTPGVLVGLG